MKPLSARTLTIYYVLALLLIAGLSLTSHVVLDVAVRKNEGDARIINESGRQRMLSQRIAGKAAEYMNGSKSARGELLTAVGQFELAHRLLAGSVKQSRDADAEYEKLYQLYFEGPDSLHKKVARFVTNARKLANVAPDDMAAPVYLSLILNEARAPLLHALDHGVVLHQRSSEGRLINVQRLQWYILGIVLLALLVEALTIFRPMIHRIVDYTSEIFRLATIDELTGAPNRRSFTDRGNEEFERSRRAETNVCLLTLDADHFKNVNDTYGHAAGDAVLKALAEAIKRVVRQSDVMGRIGGEEFAVLLPATDLAGATTLAERLRTSFAAKPISWEGQNIAVTVSIGVVEANPNMISFEKALDSADKAKYQAKESGRNRVVARAIVCSQTMNCDKDSATFAPGA